MLPRDVRRYSNRENDAIPSGRKSRDDLPIVDAKRNHALMSDQNHGRNQQSLAGRSVMLMTTEAPESTVA